MDDRQFWKLIDCAKDGAAPPAAWRRTLQTKLSLLSTDEIYNFISTYRYKEGGVNCIGAQCAFLLICDGMYSGDAFGWFLDAVVMLGELDYFKICGNFDLVIEHPHLMEFQDYNFLGTAYHVLRERGQHMPLPIIFNNLSCCLTLAQVKQCCPALYQLKAPFID